VNIARILEQRDSTVHTCNRAHGVAEAAQLLAERRIGALPVMDGDEVVGIFSERDLLYCVAKEGAAALTRSVGEVMTSPPIVVERETGVMEALSLMTRRRVIRLSAPITPVSRSTTIGGEVITSPTLRVSAVAPSLATQ